MNKGRDSRTDEQREADEQAERDFHRQREEAGLPPLNYALQLKLTIRDVTDAEAKEIMEGIVGLAHEFVMNFGVQIPRVISKVDRDERKPFLSGWTQEISPPYLGETPPDRSDFHPCCPDCRRTLARQADEIRNTSVRSAASRDF